jgi:hypothetical protein
MILRSPGNVVIVLAWILIFLCTSNYSLTLSSSGNERSLQEGIPGNSISFGLYFEANELDNVDLQSPVTLCFLIDGRKCDCYENHLLRHNLILQPGCANIIQSIRDEKSLSSSSITTSSSFSLSFGYYFSIKIYVPKMNFWIFSSSLYIPFVQNTSLIHETRQQKRTQFTLVLPLSISDLSKVMILFHSLFHNILQQTSDQPIIYEIFLIVLDIELKLIRQFVIGFQQEYDIKIRCISHSTLLHNTLTSSTKQQHKRKKKSSFSYHPQAIQQAMTLLIAPYIQTDFYLSLSIDFLCLSPNYLSTLIFAKERGLYTNDFHLQLWSKMDHLQQLYWIGSADILKINLTQYLHMIGTTFTSHSNLMFGGTPTLLNTWGALLTLQTISQHNHHHSYHPWLASYSINLLWSEYLLYRLVLEEANVFHALHIHQDEVTMYFSKNNSQFISLDYLETDSGDTTTNANNNNNNNIIKRPLKIHCNASLLLLLEDDLMNENNMINSLSNHVVTKNNNVQNDTICLFYRVKYHHQQPSQLFHQYLLYRINSKKQETII